MKIVVIYGGKSAEHDISILTAGSIIKENLFRVLRCATSVHYKRRNMVKGEALKAPVAFDQALRLTEGTVCSFCNN